MSVKVDFGEYNSLVQEVLEFTCKSNILHPGKLPTGIDAKVIHSLKEIPTEEDYYQSEVCDRTWNDILYGNESNVYEYIDKKWGSLSGFPFSRNLGSFFSEMLKKYAEVMPPEYVELWIHDSIIYYLSRCAEARCAAGTKNELLEIIYSILQSGGYPCGWEGRYPEGRMIVFYPLK